jgi:hypothetical protein
MIDRYRNLAPWRLAVYVVCIVGVIALVVWDAVANSAQP